MKVTYLTLLALIAGANVSNAQWTVAENNIYNTNTGNLGIGTITPSQKLTVSSFGNNTSFTPLLRLEQYNTGTPVAGTGVAIDMAIGDNYNLPRAAGQIRVVRSNYSNSSMYFATALSNMVRDRMVIDPDGNVGIGTLTPSQKLTVADFSDGTKTTPLLRLEQYNPGSPVNGTGVSIDMAVGDNSNAPALTGQIRLVRSNYNNSSMYFATALSNMVKDRMVIDPDGNVGIGTLTPSQKLTVTDFSDGTKTTPLLKLEQYNPGSPVNGTGVSIDMAIGDNSNAPRLAGQIRLVRSNYNYSSMYFATAANNVTTDRMVIDSHGNVGIGTLTPKEALSVNGNIRAQEIKVETSNWPDYVFKQDYQLIPLTEIKTYIDQYHRLPEIPSAIEMEKEGLDLGNMNKLLIKKVEELTLYLINQNKQLTDQLKVNSDLEERLKKLENIRK